MEEINRRSALTIGLAVWSRNEMARVELED
jgi:hypothetical protein